MKEVFEMTTYNSGMNSYEWRDYQSKMREIVMLKERNKKLNKKLKELRKELKELKKGA